MPPNEKELLQTLAVIGTEFPLRLVRQVVPLPPERLDGMLSDLQAGGFIYEQPAAGDIEYIFKHALTHDVAYNSLLSERRRMLHEQTTHASKRCTMSGSRTTTPTSPITIAQATTPPKRLSRSRRQLS